MSGRYPTFLATTGSCANPKPSCRLGFTLGQRVFAGRCQPRLGVGPSRRYLCRSFPTCLDPYPGGSCGAHTRLFPQDNGLPDVRTRSAPYHIHTATSVWACFRGCSHSLMFRPAGLLATPIAPTAVLTLGSRGFYVRAYHGSLPPRAPDMLTVRFGQLTEGDFHPSRSAALSAAPPTFRLSRRAPRGRLKPVVSCSSLFQSSRRALVEHAPW